MDVADAVVGTEVEVIADAPLLVQAQPNIVLIPALRAFGAEEGGADGEEGGRRMGEVGDQPKRGRTAGLVTLPMALRGSAGTTASRCGTL